jgi:pSer/pThr/pTyr-binding forkhead associated (FHA) protein
VIVIRVGDDGPQYQGHGPVTIGRDEACDLQLLDPISSRRHVVIRRDGSEWIAEDQGSRNGTRLGDQERPITHAILRAGDVLRVGDTELFISFDQTVPDLEIEPLRFTILEPASAAGEIRCTRDSVTLGRHPSCDVVVDDPTVSRLHAVVAKTSAGYVINDQRPPTPSTLAIRPNGSRRPCSTTARRSGSAAPGCGCTS